MLFAFMWIEVLVFKLLVVPLLFVLPIYFVKKNRPLYAFLGNVVVLSIVFIVSLLFTGMPRIHYTLWCGTCNASRSFRDFYLPFHITAGIVNAIYPNSYVTATSYGWRLNRYCKALLANEDNVVGGYYDVVDRHIEDLIYTYKRQGLDEKAIDQKIKQTTEECKLLEVKKKNFNPYLYILNGFIFF